MVWQTIISGKDTGGWSTPPPPPTTHTHTCPVVTLPIRVTCPSNEGVRLAPPLMNSLVDTEASSTEEPPLAHSALLTDPACSSTGFLLYSVHLCLFRSPGRLKLLPHTAHVTSSVVAPLLTKAWGCCLLPLRVTLDLHSAKRMCHIYI